MNIIEILEKEQLRSDIPAFGPGDTVRVHARIVEGTRERIQVFEGVVIGRQGTGVRETFTVRRIASGVYCKDRGDTPRHRPPRKALLSARSYGQGGTYSRKALMVREMGTAAAVPIFAV